MTTVEVYAQLAADRGRELRREAAQARLAALARCCRPSTWRRVLRRVGRRRVHPRG